MRIQSTALLASALWLLPVAAWSQELETGQYRLVTYLGTTRSTICLIKLERPTGELEAAVVATSPQLGALKVSHLEQDGLELHLELDARGQFLQFKGRIGERNEVRGVVINPLRTTLARLAPTELTELAGRDLLERLPESRDFMAAVGQRDPQEKLKRLRDFVQAHSESPGIFEAYRQILLAAKSAGTDPEELNEVSVAYEEKAKAWHPQWHQSVLLEIAVDLNRAELLPELALRYARRARAALDQTAAPETIRTVDLTLVRALIAAEQFAEAERLLSDWRLRQPDDAEIAFQLGLVKEKSGDLDGAISLWSPLFTYRPAAEPLRRAWEQKHGSLKGFEEMLDSVYLKHVPPFRPESYGGRRSPAANGTVLVELFTGATCPPCVAADVAYDALQKTYASGEVIFLQYHLHIPGPDPMTNADSEARAKYYEVRGTPSSYFNGIGEAYGGGPMESAQAKYAQYRQAIDPRLEARAAGTLKLRVAREEKSIRIEATVSGLAPEGKSLPETLKLRVAVVEQTVRFAGSNGLRLHHAVVRAMPGGPEGVGITEAMFSHSALVNLGEVRESLEVFLATHEAKSSSGQRPFSFSAKPLDLERLKVVAFVQDDDTREVLLAAEAEVPPG